jgi:periplasmic copper chaperone A
MPLGEFQEDMRVGEGLPLVLCERRYTMRRSMTNLAVKITCYSFAALTLTLASFSSGSARAADYNVGSIHISQPWARATPKGASSGAAYMTITNKGSTPDRVSCVSSDISAKCQIHSMTMDNGVMKMRPVEGGLEIKPGETVMLKPSGFHVMLVDLKHPLEKGKMVEATLQFEKAGAVKVEFPIAAIGSSAPGAPTGGNMMMDHGSMQMNHH